MLPSLTIKQMNREAVEVRGDEHEVSPSCEQQELWSLRSDVFQRESKRTNFSTIFELCKRSQLGQLSKD